LALHLGSFYGIFACVLLRLRLHFGIFASAWTCHWPYNWAVFTVFLQLRLIALVVTLGCFRLRLDLSLGLHLSLSF